MTPDSPPISLKQCEEIIGRGISSFIEVGNALRAIRDGKLYKAEFKTFEEYCQQRWNWGRAYANRQIAASDTVENLAPRGAIVVTEKLIRPIVNLELDVQKKVWNQAIEAAGKGKITAKQVAEIAAEYKPSRPRPKFDPAIAQAHLENDLAKHRRIWPAEYHGAMANVLRYYADSLCDDLKRKNK